jgi:hypothetical protein
VDVRQRGARRVGKHADIRRVQRRDGCIARDEYRNVQCLRPVETVEAAMARRREDAGLRALLLLLRVCLGRGGCHGRIQRVEFAQHHRRLFYRGNLDPLHLLQHRPAAIADPADQREQHQSGADRARLDPREHAVGGGREGQARLCQRVARLEPRRVLGRPADGRCLVGHPVRDGEAAFGTEMGKRLVRVHPQIAGIGAHIAGNEARRVEGRRVTILDGSDVAGPDAQFALHVQKRLAERRALPAHDIAKPEREIVETLRLTGLLIIGCTGFAPNHAACPIMPTLAQCLPVFFGCRRLARIRY